MGMDLWETAAKVVFYGHVGGNYASISAPDWKCLLLESDGRIVTAEVQTPKIGKLVSLNARPAMCTNSHLRDLRRVAKADRPSFSLPLLHCGNIPPFPILNNCHFCFFALYYGQGEMLWLLLMPVLLWETEHAEH